MLQDFKFAVRSLLRNPLFTAGAAAALALGIGVNSTIFTITNAALYRPMPGIADADRLAWIASVWRDRGREIGMSYPDFADYRAHTRDVFSDLLAFRATPLHLGSGGEPERIRGHLVTGSYFATLRVTPAAGRLFSDDDDLTGAPVAVISHRLWQQRFNGSTAALSQSIGINGRLFAIVGVAPRGFSGPALGSAADVWIPLALLPHVRSADRDLLTARGASWLTVMGRLRPSVSLSRAQASLGTVAAHLEQMYPGTNENRGVAASSGMSGVDPEGRRELIPLSALLLTVTGMVLLIACANVANLLLARGAGRALEISIRAAIGASRRRLLRQLLIESLVLGAAGAAAGLVLCFWASDIMVARLPDAEFRGLSAGVDARVLIFTTTIGVLSVCAFGLLPALSTTRGALLPRLRETAAAGGRSRLQGIFVVAQLSLSLVLLLAAGLSLRAMQKANAIDLGFNPDGLLTASYDLELQNYTPDRRIAFRRELRAGIAAMPGVIAVFMTNVPPLSGVMVSTVVTTRGTTGDDIESRAYLNGAGPGYFKTMQIPIVAGREFGDQDTAGAPRAAIVNETLARRLFDSSAAAVGRTLTLGPNTLQVVGVAHDSKYDEPTEDRRPFLYTSLDQDPQLDREAVVVRATVPPTSLVQAVRARIQALEPALPAFDVQPMSEMLADRADKQRAMSMLLAAFGAVALLLASLGIYGVMAYAVMRRTRELGIRMALGATPGQLSALIARDGLRLSLVGVAIGGTLSLPMGFALGAMLFGVRIVDVAAFGAICALLVAVAMIAAVIPARRAAALDPISALRAD